MGEVIRSIKFEHFRGLPNNEFKLNGKNFVFLGANGKGKSSIIDGIEFLFSGQVSRFVGTGTRSINHDEAIQHIQNRGTPKVTVCLNPSNGEISRELNAESVAITNRGNERAYFQQHSGVDTYILRRSKILEFICDQDADRYQKFIRLLGISKIDQLQRCFVDAERELQTSENHARTTLITKLAVFNNPVEGFSPTTLRQIFDRISDSIHSFGLDKLDQWSDATVRLPLLKAMRPEANREKIDALTTAIVNLEMPLPLAVDDDIHNANSLRQKLLALESSSVDAPRYNVITEGYAYLSMYDSEVNCPLCEEPFSKSISEVIARLKQRRDDLSELQNTVTRRRSSIEHIISYIDNIESQLRRDLKHSNLMESGTIQSLRDILASTLCWRRTIKRVESSNENIDLVIPDRISSLDEIRRACVVNLKTKKATLVPPDSSKLEAAIDLLERGIVSYQDISISENAVVKASRLASQSTIVKNAFSRARESAIQKVFDQISDTVLNYYQRLHNCTEIGEESECTALEIKPTSRAATGGLRLAIQFLGLVNKKDPRVFLSEGHLDSLGLCLFLATVHIFNPPGTLLVLDDILTSIDKEHRRRVGELLFQEFSNYQVILTTHDDHWYELLQSSAIAWGRQANWRFIKVRGWCLDSGTTQSEIDGSWSFVDSHLTEEEYRELGGSFRLILEDFLKRTADKLEVKVRFKIDGKYTSGDFAFAGIQNTIRERLIEKTPDEEIGICTDIGRVFGQGDLVNFLSHDNPGRLEVTLSQAQDFVQGLRDLTRRCEEHKLIKGRQ